VSCAVLHHTRALKIRNNIRDTKFASLKYVRFNTESREYDYSRSRFVVRVRKRTNGGGGKKYNVRTIKRPRKMLFKYCLNEVPATQNSN